MAPGYPLNDEIIAPIVPVDEEITDGWGFELWHKKGLGEYMCINAFTAEGMEKVAEINGITLPEDFFGGKTNAELHNSFIRLSSCLHHLGNYKGIHINFIEGMHRQMAWTHAFMEHHSIKMDLLNPTLCLSKILLTPTSRWKTNALLMVKMNTMTITTDLLTMRPFERNCVSDSSKPRMTNFFKYHYQCTMSTRNKLMGNS